MKESLLYLLLFQQTPSRSSSWRRAASSDPVSRLVLFTGSLRIYYVLYVERCMAKAWEGPGISWLLLLLAFGVFLLYTSTKIDPGLQVWSNQLFFPHRKFPIELHLSKVCVPSKIRIWLVIFNL
jgi:hypothetical protein